MLAGSGLGDDALLAHAAGEQRLAERVVDLVRAGVEEVFTLEVDLGSAALFREPLGEVERRRTAAVVVKQPVELGVEGRVGVGHGVGLLEFFEGGHEGLRDVAAAVGSETSGDCGWMFGQDSGCGLDFK